MRRYALFLACLLLVASCGVRDPGASPIASPQTNGAASVDCAAFLIPTPAPAQLTSSPAPTALPVSPPASPAPTEVVTPPPISYEDRAATAVTIATVQPFPTAAPAEVRAGQPAEARGERGGLKLTLIVPSDQFLAGEATQAVLILQNTSVEPLVIAGDGRQLGWLQLFDERGEIPAAWPWAETARPGGVFFAPLPPGATISATLTLQTPPLAAAAEQHLALWAATRFARTVPGADGPDNIWLHLEAGPIPLTLVAPRPDQQLRATLALDRSGYALEARTSDGQPVAGAWGELEASFSVPGQFEAFSSRSLAAANGTWTGGWDAQMRPEQAQIVARAWVAAPGFVTAALTQTVSTAPLTAEEAGRVFGGGWAPCRQEFADPTAASAGLGLPIARLATLSAGAALLAVQAEVVPGWAMITTRYDLPNQAWLTLTQRVTTEQYDSAGWGETRYDSEAQPVLVGAEAGYLIRRYDVWVLNWKLGTTGLELRAPASAFSADALTQLAAGVTLAP